MQKGSIYYDTKRNIYHIIATDILVGNTIECLLIEGYQTQHKFISSIIFSADFYDRNEERYVQVGGIY